MLWSLPRAAPALLRHIAAYVDLASLDLARAKRELGSELVTGAILAICAVFTLLLVCLLVIAWTWDTPYRIAAIAWMTGVFLAAAVAAAVYRSRVVSARSHMLESVRQQWQEDRVLLERILSDEE